MTITATRVRRGSKLHPMGTDVYAVALGEDGVEVSDRHSGQAWIAMSEGVCNFVFVDEHGGRSSTFTLTKNPRGGRVRLVVLIDGDIAQSTPVPESTWKGDSLVMSWGAMYDQVV